MNKKFAIYFICFLSLGFISGCRKDVSEVDPNLYGYWSDKPSGYQGQCWWDLIINDDNNGSFGPNGSVDDCKRDWFHHSVLDNKVYITRGKYIHIGRFTYTITEFPRRTGVISSKGIEEWIMRISSGHSNGIGGILYKYE